MRRELEDILYEELENELSEFNRMNLGSDDYVKTAKSTTDMIDKLNESEKIKNEKRRLDIEERKLDIESERNVIEKRNGLTKSIVTGLMFAISTGVTIWANIDSKRFEQDYTHTTEAGRGSTKKLLGLLDKFKAGRNSKCRDSEKSESLFFI